MTLLSEIKGIVPGDKYIDASTIPARYAEKYKKKLNTQPSATKVVAFLEKYPLIFSVVGTVSIKNPKAIIYEVKQIFESDIVATQVPPSDPPKPVTVKDTVSKSAKAIRKLAKLEAYQAKVAAEASRAAELRASRKDAASATNTKSTPHHVPKSRTAAPVHLNDRNEVTVPLTELTSYLQGSRKSVPRGQLSSFVFTRNAKRMAESRHSLITETSDNRGSVGSTLLGLSLDADWSDWRSTGGDEDDRSEGGGSCDDGSEGNEYNDEASDSSSGDNASDREVEKSVYLNTNEPFCAICIGVQGAGKSHTMNVILENCLLGKVETEDDVSIIATTQPMCGLVLHYDQSQSNVCEAVGLCAHAARLGKFPELKVERLVVLVSPTYYIQRKAFYGNHCEVIPLLFDWDSLSATQLKKLMRLSDTDAQLYVSVILNKLREYQRKNKIPSFDGFLQEVTELCNVSGQSAPLTQRLELLKSVVRESEPNKDLKSVGYNLTSLLSAGTLVVADLTDPMMSADEACGVFQVLLEQFRSHPLGDVGKVVTFDEAHKYLNKSGPGCIELSNAIVDTVRLMRHEGIRVLISTQSPLTMPPELLELASVTILHKFQSADWAKYLGSKVTLPPNGFEEIQSLQQGEALLLSTQIDVSERENSVGEERASVVNHLKVSVRPRLTLDLGASRRNNFEGADEFIEKFDRLNVA